MNFIDFKATILYCFAGLLALSLFACNSGPKVIESESANEAATSPEAGNSDDNSIPSLQEAGGTTTTAEDQHKVVVNEVLNTDRYTYLSVEEEGEDYWIAISKREVAEGETYYFKGGLMKKNFFSQEFNRVFETLYLVSNFWKQPSGSEAALDEAFAQMNANQGQADLKVEEGDIEPAQGAIPIADLMANKEKYNNQTIKVTGKCVKVNPMIMNRNWVHLQDGSGEEVDLTITTSESIPLGAVVTLEGTIALNKDFGAGYRYDIIMEEAVLR